MAKKSDSTFREILNAIKKGTIAPIYILCGDEPYYLDKLCDMLEATVVEEADTDFNADILYGSDSTAEMVEASARQFPMMSPRRLVVLKEAQTMERAKAQIEKLLPYFKQPTSTTVLVIVYKGEESPLNAAATKAINAAGGIIFKSSKLRDYQISEPIRDYCTAKKISIEDKALQLLVESVGLDLSKLFSEIDKLMVACNGKLNRITPDMIEENIGISKVFNNFELTNALAVRNYSKAMKIVEFFSRSPNQNPTVVTTATIFSYFQKIVIAQLERDKSDQNISQVLNLKNSFALRDIRTAMANFNLNQCLMIISAIADFDRRSKGIGSVANEFELLRELIFKICTV
ncbi:MAG: DNA polymerase III subunit delta [Clostridium sp.]|nr:DNA polymerase III subunit delta [Prevotella sp.]MCM1428821.1 DNA polymerase III subunit delta [Clostridium sp.]MCM1475196.1 DNA polymerase III subunit delta [Muribaculaceae bacterium]